MVLTFFLTSGCAALWLFKWLHWGASLSFDFNLGTWTRGQALTVLQPHAPCNILSPFGNQGLGVAGWGLWLTASAPWFTLIGHFRVHLGGSGGGHDRRWAYHGLRLRFRADRQRKEKKITGIIKTFTLCIKRRTKDYLYFSKMVHKRYITNFNIMSC